MSVGGHHAKDLIAKIELFQDGVVVQTEKPDRRRCDWDLKLSQGRGCTTTS